MGWIISSVRMRCVISKTVEEVQSVLDRIEYRDWEFKAFPVGDRVAFEASFITEDAYDLTKPWQVYTREWLISDIADEGMIVRTAWACVAHQLGHEAREYFKLDGQRVMSPHANGEGHSDEEITLCA